MTQSKTDSFMEAITNTAVGWVIATVTWWAVGRMMGYQMNAAQNQTVVGIFTVISIVRQYILRRVFNGRSVWQAIKVNFSR